MTVKKKRNAQDKTKRDSVSRAELHGLEKRIEQLERLVAKIKALVVL